MYGDRKYHQRELRSGLLTSERAKTLVVSTINVIQEAVANVNLGKSPPPAGIGCALHQKLHDDLPLTMALATSFTSKFFYDAKLKLNLRIDAPLCGTAMRVKFPTGLAIAMTG
ncbi:hypothetical protein FVEG_00196 [Fusarium verticillioides 7600]|uniref:Uncharacterized protein n=1 Tax=Gibberella moniliformis (strain M3125 / FGSC 7600) TaxID=334819 RepID=W7LTY1_GIBM7|nr:hypothetical protein FVEG_00196 [Fusarium verticillioides 7600]EWG36027.1 hypothetical protein FVEG_00196 [Fusarium verticillioides 7600]